MNRVASDTMRKVDAMEKLPRLLIEAQAQSGVSVIHTSPERTDTNARTVPYVERYAGSTGLFQTPAQRLQEAAQDGDQ
jgi:hypothetical protein